MLGRVISKILFSLFPVDMKLILSLYITNPIKSHVRGFGYALDYGVGDDANGTFVVKLNWIWSLFVAISCNVVCMGTALFAFVKPDPVSDSWTEDISVSIILLIMRTGSLIGGGGLSVLMGSFGLSVK